MKKEQMIKDFTDYMFLKTNRMFKWENLPETIPPYIMERFLQENGKCIFYKYKKSFYVFDFSYSKESNVYYEPKGILFTNVDLGITVNENRSIDNTTENGVIIMNDTKIKGLKPIFLKYGELLSENEITLKVHAQLDRMKSFITASDDKSKKESEVFLNRIKNGELSVIGDNALFESVKMFNSNTGDSTLTQYMELIQYLKSSCMNEIGINSNYNMKRERINTAEIQLNDFGLLPLCNLMLECRKEAVEKINEKFNLNIKVSLNDIWELEKTTLADTLDEHKGTDTQKETADETDDDKSDDDKSDDKSDDDKSDDKSDDETDEK